jgi:menaquinone-dependent protoporphyrinogen IX oxidase
VPYDTEYTFNGFTLDQIDAMNEVELIEQMAVLKAAISDINGQLQVERERKKEGESSIRPADWSKKANSALRHKVKALQQMKIAVTRLNKTRDKSKPENRAAAFIKAAMVMLPEDRIQAIWKTAVQLYPNAFDRS